MAVRILKRAPRCGNPEVAGSQVTSTEILDPGAGSFPAIVAPDWNQKEELPPKPRMERNPPDGTGPVHVPLGHIVANEKWRGSQLAQEMQGKVRLIFEEGLASADFYLSSKSCILYITEADLVAGHGYRKRLARFRNSAHLQGIIIVEKTQMSEQYFPAVQKFTVLDLGMVLLPVASQSEASCLIIQLVQEQTREPSKNPFLRKKRSMLSEFSLVQTVQQIPGVGKVKAPLLLQKFSSIQQLSNASVQELEEVVGRAVAQQIHTFFTQPTRQQPCS